MCAGFPLTIQGIPIRTSEALYQLSRFPEYPEIQQLILSQKSPMAAKMVTKPYRTEHNRPDWIQVRVPIMRWCLQVKLQQHPLEFGSVLNQTLGKPIVEYSRKDSFWGAIPISSSGEILKGHNILGRLLTELRENMIPFPAHCTEVHPPEITNFKILGKDILAI